jgi:uncharacterized membrane protein YidH (DUF202 family)
MHESPDRVEEFRAEIEAMKLRDPSAAADRTFLRVGIAGMVGGIALGVFAYFFSHGTTNALQQRDAIVIALIGLSVAACGAALFLRASLGTFLRFWMARVCHEQAAQADRVVSALGTEQPAPEPPVISPTG